MPGGLNGVNRCPETPSLVQTGGPEPVNDPEGAGRLGTYKECERGTGTGEPDWTLEVCTTRDGTRGASRSGSIAGTCDKKEGTACSRQSP